MPDQEVNAITQKIIGCAYSVSNTLGIGFVEKVYENVVLVELKAASLLVKEHTAQALNYLRATGLPVCLLINFGRPKVEIQRLLPSKYWQVTSP